MKEEPNTNMMSQRRAAIWEVCKVQLIIAGLMILMTFGMAIMGQFRIDTSSTYGLYESGLGFEAYLNPFWKLIADTQLVALMILPLPLFILRRRLGVAVVPWVLVALFTLIGATTRLYYPPLYDRFDPSLDSRLWLLLRANVFIGLSILVSYFAYLGYRNRQEIWVKYRGYLTKRNIFIGSILFVLGTGLLFYNLQPVQVCESYEIKYQTVKNCYFVRRIHL
jgi:hypothetical protein